MIDLWLPPRPSGPSMSARHREGWSFHEDYVVALVIESLLARGYDARWMQPERTLTPAGPRPDLTIEPPSQTGRAVELWEAKPRRPITADRRQAQRYVQVGEWRWPDRPVRVYLVWPAEPLAFPFDSSALIVEPAS